MRLQLFREFEDTHWHLRRPLILCNTAQLIKAKFRVMPALSDESKFRMVDTHPDGSFFVTMGEVVCPTCTQLIAENIKQLERLTTFYGMGNKRDVNHSST